MEDRKFVNNQQPIYETVRRVTTGFASHILIFTFRVGMNRKICCNSIHLSHSYIHQTIYLTRSLSQDSRTQRYQEHKAQPTAQQWQKPDHPPLRHQATHPKGIQQPRWPI